jgi:hypothetical protein
VDWRPSHPKEAMKMSVAATPHGVFRWRARSLSPLSRPLEDPPWWKRGRGWAGEFSTATSSSISSRSRVRGWPPPANDVAGTLRVPSGRETDKTTAHGVCLLLPLSRRKRVGGEGDRASCCAQQLADRSLRLRSELAVSDNFVPLRRHQGDEYDDRNILAQHASRSVAHGDPT